jgi:hypothetical protein
VGTILKEVARLQLSLVAQVVVIGQVRKKGYQPDMFFILKRKNRKNVV